MAGRERAGGDAQGVGKVPKVTGGQRGVSGAPLHFHPPASPPTHALAATGCLFTVPYLLHIYCIFTAYLQFQAAYLQFQAAYLQFQGF